MPALSGIACSVSVPVMADLYKDQAAYCVDMARKSATDELRARWLQLAQMYHQMAEENPREKRSAKGDLEA